VTIPFDKDALLDRVDGDAEFLAETVEILDEDAPSLLEEIRGAAGARDAARLATAAHTMKGLVSNFCAEPAREAAERLEVMGRGGDLDQSGHLDEAVTTLETEAGRLNTALHELVKELSE